MKKPIPFGKYYLLERINVGGMAEVFRAKAYGVEGFERLVAVKRILPNIAEDKEFIRMFIDEAKIAVQLNHANIAQIFDLGMVEQAYYIALEHVHGRDLRAIFDRCRHRTEPMPIAQACFVTMKVCEGLDYAHNKRDQGGRELNLVHRDVSPQNVLVSFEGEVKIIDFGIAKAAGKGSRTQAGILKGKFGYMSPEQVRGLPIDRRSDVFSCGIVLYELLTGERLFVGESDFSTLEKVRNVEILPPSTYNRKIPDELERIVLKALAKDVEDRYQNAIDLHDELQAFVYTAGEFYSRKDLAAWMKTTFAREIAEETAKLESYSQIDAPPAARAERGRPTPPRRQTRSLGNGTRPPPVPPSGAAAKKSQQVPAQQGLGPGGLEWDDDELETSIYPEDERAPKQSLAGQLAAAQDMPDEGPLSATSQNWPPAQMPPQGRPVMGSVAEGSSNRVIDSERTIDETMGARGQASDPSAVVELESLAESRIREPVYGGELGDSAFGSSYLAHNKGTGLKKSTVVQLAIGATIAVAAVILIIVMINSGGESQAQKPDNSADSAGAAMAATDETSDKADQAVAAVDPNSGFDLIVNPSGVKVKLDGRPIGKAPLQIRNLTEGEHEVEIEAPPGFVGKTETVTVERGKAERVMLQLDPMDVVGRFSSDPPGARVTLLIDGDKHTLGPTPVDFKLDPRSRYEAVFSKDGYEPVTRVVTMTGAQEILVSADLERMRRSRTEVTEVSDRSSSSDGSSSDRSSSSDRASTTTDRSSTGSDRRPPEEAVVKSDPEPADEGKEEFGTLGLSAKPPCKIFIDGRDTGFKTPKVGIKLKAGRHRITLVNNEFGIKESFVVRIKAGEATKAIKDLTSRLPQ